MFTYSAILTRSLHNYDFIFKLRNIYHCISILYYRPYFNISNMTGYIIKTQIIVLSFLHSCKHNFRIKAFVDISNAF